MRSRSRRSTTFDNIPCLSKALEFEVVGSSEFIRIECKRVLLRYRLEGLIRDAQIRDAILLSLISERRDLGTWRTAQCSNETVLERNSARTNRTLPRRPGRVQGLPDPRYCHHQERDHRKSNIQVANPIDYYETALLVLFQYKRERTVPRF
jgi:hypothetical protein